MSFARSRISLGNPAEPRDLDPVALVRAARNDLAQENDLLVPFAHRDVEIAHAARVPRQLGQLVIMGREKRARLDLVVQKFRHAPGDRKAVEGRSAAADLIQNDQAALGRVVHDVRRLVHLDHEGRLAAREIVVRADAGENAIDQTDLRARRRNEAADLRHQNNQRHLPDVGRFPGHVRPGDDGQSHLLAIELGVVRHKFLFGQILIEHRMTPVLDDRAAANRPVPAGNNERAAPFRRAQQIDIESRDARPRFAGSAPVSRSVSSRSF